MSIYVRDDDGNIIAKPVQSKIHTVSYDDYNSLFRITIPPSMIPNELKDTIKENKARIRECKDKGLKKEAKRLKQELEQLYSLFISIRPNIIVQSLFLSKTKDQARTQKEEILSKALNSTGEFFDKQVGVILAQKEKSLQEFDADVSEAMESLKEKNALLKQTLIKMIRLMIYAEVNASQYDGEKGFDEYVKMNEDQDALIEELLEADREQIEKMWVVDENE